ncbi:dTDP-glucose 4,6-dehydratase [Paenibacillus turicensis]|uniref:dTDP-glucose 4,6-dehydratase n=1 Tax=Paenibacillus turicensis TaxID=160487 RepID=A0ABS4FXA5_9BACL|nr:dTDP-glucose 4,6-dehydratase [Paenibacillus turicensis]MBP1907218.1 dTDP-glucose 4,6-dehydratase [Paenibacillus turicensis]
MRTILVTGGAGFIGSAYIKYMLNKYPDYKIINVDALTYAGNLLNLHEVSSNYNYIFIKANVTDRIAIEQIFESFRIDYVVNFAAESHVDKSIDNPELFLKTNVLGTQILLEISRKYWVLNSEDKFSREYRHGVKFLQVSTDEVYGTLDNDDELFVESSSLMPNSPYSASKASADMFVRSYYETFGLPINITRCSNNYGPNQFPEKLIPLIIINSLKGRRIPIYGDGKYIRDWLHVNDHCSALENVLHHGSPGEIYNVGSNNEKENIELVRLILNATGQKENLIEFVQDRPGHDRRYAINNNKIVKELGWQPKYSFEKGLLETIKWYEENNTWTESVLSGDYLKYNSYRSKIS